MTARVVKPRLSGRILAYLLSGILLTGAVIAAVWCMLSYAPVAGLFLFVLLLLALLVGGGEIVGEIAGTIAGEWLISAVALRLTAAAVERSTLLSLFFYIDESSFTKQINIQ